VRQRLRLGCAITSIPQITAIANRFLRARDAALLLADARALAPFCDTSAYDHFPVFQLSPGPHELLFGLAFRSLSFWFKFEVASDAQLSFFRTNGAELSVRGDLLRMVVGGLEFRAAFAPGRWHRVSFAAADGCKSVSVRCGDQTAVFEAPTKDRSAFNLAAFSNGGRGLLFLGSAIHFHLRAPADAPGAVGGECDCDCAITPDGLRADAPEYSAVIPGTCFCVPHCGLPRFAAASSSSAPELRSTRSLQPTQSPERSRRPPSGPSYSRRSAGPEVFLRALPPAALRDSSQWCSSIATSGRRSAEVR
jgi:hypothetical protein